MVFIPAEKYKEIMEQLPIFCVDLYIEKEGKILTILRKNPPLNNQYWLPGGRVKKNEKIEDAVLRKAKEECGVDVEIEKEIGFYELMEKEGVFKDLKTGVHTVSLIFKVRLKKNQEIKIDKDHSDFKWLDRNDFSEELKKTIKNLHF